MKLIATVVLDVTPKVENYVYFCDIFKIYTYFDDTLKKSVHLYNKIAFKNNVKIP